MTVIVESTITLPHCRHAESETMPALNRLDFIKAIARQRYQRRGKGRHPVFVALAGTHCNLFVFVIEILNSEPDHLGNP